MNLEDLVDQSDRFQNYADDAKKARKANVSRECQTIADSLFVLAVVIARERNDAYNWLGEGDE